MLTRRQRYAIEGRKPAKQTPEDRVRNFNEVYQGQANRSPIVA